MIMLKPIELRCPIVYQARNQLGTPGGAKRFLRWAQIFELCPIVLYHEQNIFPGGRKLF